MGKSIKILSIIAGIIMSGIGLALMFINPAVAGQLPEGFFTPIIALEFMSNTEDLSRFFNITSVAELKNSFLLGNQVDYAFMFAYGIFALLCGRLIYLDSRIKTVWLSFPLVLLIIFSDLFENMNIAEILAMKEYYNAELILDQLQLFTWLKWGSLSALMLLYSVYFLQGNWWKIIIGVIMLSSFCFAVTAFYLGGIYCEIMSVNIMASFIGLLIFAIIWKPSGKSVDLQPL